MANELDELTGPVNSEGRDINVIEKQLDVKLSFSTKFFDASLWLLGPLIAFGFTYGVTSDAQTALMVLPAGILPGIIFWFMKRSAEAYLRKLQQRIQAASSQIDNFMEQRVQILQNLAQLLDKSVDLDKDVMKTVAAYRGGVNPNADEARNETSALLENAFSRINLAFEAYPNLKAQDNIAEAMRQNSYLQREITAARVLQNDAVSTWNQEIFAWPTKQIVAAKNHWTTRIPYTVSSEVRAQARGTFF